MARLKEVCSFFGTSFDAINRRQGTEYDLQVIHLNAADYGVPQIRERVFILASIDGRTLKVPPPTHGDARWSRTRTVLPGMR